MSTRAWLGADAGLKADGGRLVDVKVVGLDAVIDELRWKYPDRIDRARKSALKSAGYLIRTEVRNHIEYGGTGWPELHPLTQKFRDFKGWRSRGGGSPLFWLGKFARYAMIDNDNGVEIGLGTTRKKQAGQVDKYLQAIARKHERGARVKVTEKMRGKWAKTRPQGKKGRKAAQGRDYFALQASTKWLKIPRRPTFGPVYNKVSPRIPGYMREKFFAALRRYEGAETK